jgi:hypothetical protein
LQLLLLLLLLLLHSVCSNWDSQKPDLPLGQCWPQRLGNCDVIKWLDVW